MSLFNIIVSTAKLIREIIARFTSFFLEGRGEGDWGGHK